MLFNTSISKAQEQIIQLSSKLQRLLDSYLDGDVECELYQTKREDILSEKKCLQGQIKQSSLGVLAWVEPMKCWIENIWLWFRQSLEKAARQGDRFRFSSEMVQNYRIYLNFLNTLWTTPVQLQ